MKESSKEERAFLQKIYQDVKVKCKTIEEPSVQAKKKEEEGGAEEAKADGDQEGNECESPTKVPGKA